MEDEEEVEEETTSASEESSEDEEEVPEKPAPGLEPMGTGLVPNSIKTKEPFVEVEEAEYLPPVTSLDTSDEFLPDISDPGKYLHTLLKFMLKLFEIFLLKLASINEGV